MAILDFPDFGTVNSIHAADASGSPASGINVSSATNENALAAYGMDAYADDGFEGGTQKASRKSGIHGHIHGDMWDNSGYNGNDGGQLVSQTAGMEGTPSGSPVAAWFGLVALVVIMKLIAEKNGEEAEFKTVRIGATNIAIITISAIVGMTLLKWVFGIYKVPGISQVVEAA